ncbi:uncharacterized protein [Physcomitrium patens]|uniref:uncharacterized protein isoform X2 n=1 Tax=Physcomitrium patens TaxID=3218 RepID=UPI000D1670B8|nr:phosphatidylinositol 4-phosphate 5-kinase 2-like isoform X2 [Physcomitrium patens]|eukprot:XP_024381142.1 phosphatidylinositol 4-phosphate 5-kinase 2-like isoform X2 [Physcomitrella patens]
MVAKKGPNKKPIVSNVLVNKSEGECISGAGKFFYPTGATYEGDWVVVAEVDEGVPATPPPPPGGGAPPHPPLEQMRPNRQRHGKGCFKYESGASYDGQWNNNVYTGLGTYMWPNGAKYVGGWLENKMHGDGMYKDKDGNSWTGQFFNGIGPGLIMEIQ